jgi:hypothetical protein
MMMYMGMGFKKGRCTIDVSTQLIDGWFSLGIFNGPPPSAFTMTVDLH